MTTITAERIKHEEKWLKGKSGLATPVTLNQLTPTDTMIHWHRVNALNDVAWNDLDPDIVLRAYRLIDEQKKRDAEGDA